MPSEVGEDHDSVTVRVVEPAWLRRTAYATWLVPIVPLVIGPFTMLGTGVFDSPLLIGAMALGLAIWSVSGALLRLRRPGSLVLTRWVAAFSWLVAFPALALGLAAVLAVPLVGMAAIPLIALIGVVGTSMLLRRRITELVISTRELVVRTEAGTERFPITSAERVQFGPAWMTLTVDGRAHSYLHGMEPDLRAQVSGRILDAADSAREHQQPEQPPPESLLRMAARAAAQEERR